MRGGTPLPVLAPLLQQRHSAACDAQRLAELARRVEELTRAAQAGADVLEHYASSLPSQDRTARRIRRAVAALHRPL